MRQPQLFWAIISHVTSPSNNTHVVLVGACTTLKNISCIICGYFSATTIIYDDFAAIAAVLQPAMSCVLVPFRALLRAFRKKSKAKVAPGATDGETEPRRVSNVNTLIKVAWGLDVEFHLSSLFLPYYHIETTQCVSFIDCLQCRHLIPALNA